MGSSPPPDADADADPLSSSSSAASSRRLFHSSPPPLLRPLTTSSTASPPQPRHPHPPAPPLYYATQQQQQALLPSALRVSSGSTPPSPPPQTQGILLHPPSRGFNPKFSGHALTHPSAAAGFPHPPFPPQIRPFGPPSHSDQSLQLLRPPQLLRSRTAAPTKGISVSPSPEVCNFSSVCMSRAFFRVLTEMGS